MKGGGRGPKASELEKGVQRGLTKKNELNRE